MRRFFWLFIVVIFISVNTFSISESFDLQKSIKTFFSLKKEERIKVAKKIFKTSINSNKPEILKNFAEKYLKFADNDEEIMFAKKYLAISFWYLNNHKKAFEILDEAINVAKKIGNKKELAILYYDKGIFLNEINRYKDATIFFKKAEQYVSYLTFTLKDSLYYYEATNYELMFDYENAILSYKKLLNLYLNKSKKSEDDLLYIAYIYYYIGNVYSNIPDISRSINYFSKAMKMANELNDENLKASVYQGLGSIYLKAGFYKMALFYSNKAISYFKKQNNEYSLADLYNQIANIYSGFDKLDDALKYYNLSLKYYKKHPKNNKTSLAMVYTNIGIIYKTQKKYKKAMELFKNALKIQKEVNNRLEIAALYAQIGMIYYVWGNYNSALKYEKMALKIDEELKNRDDLMGVYFTLSYIYEKLNNYKLALFYRTKYVNLYASTYSEENFKKLASLKTKYEKLKAENELIKLKNKEKSYKLMKDLFVLIIVFVFVLAGFIIERIKKYKPA